MKTPDVGGWQRTSPFAVLFFIGRTIRLLVKNGWQSLAPLVAVFATGQFDFQTMLGIAGFVLSGLIIGGSILSYWFFRFRLTTSSILIREGVIKKKQLDIKFDRIQGINTQQNPIYRYLGLLTVTFDTAGSTGSEGSLPAVTREFADSLRERIGKKRSPAAADMADEAEEPRATRHLVQLDWRDMIRIGLADRRALIVFALIGPLMEQIGDEIDSYIEQAVIQAATYGIHFDAASGIWVAVTIIALALLLFAAISIAAAFLSYHRFTLWLDDETLRSRGGLITTHEHSMDLGKIQTLRLTQGLVERWQKRFKMTARQAKAGNKEQAGKVFMIPSVDVSTADSLRSRFMGPEGGRLSQDPRSAAFERVSRYYMRSKILYVGALPALLGAALFRGNFGPLGWLCLLWLPLVAAVSYQLWRRTAFVHDDEEVVRRSGFLGFRTSALLFRKVQRVSVLQTPHQRRKGLATLKMYMASGAVRVPYINVERANQLRDYILFKVESSDKAWH